jgi:hypothetical protein
MRLSIERINGVLESKFGFWLVTSVLAGVVAVVCTYSQTYFVEMRRAKSLAGRLDLEIECRVSQFMVALS